MQREVLEGYVKEGLSLDAIAARAGCHHSTVSYWIKQYDLRPANRAKYAPKGGISRNELEPLVARGLTLAEMSAVLRVSVATVRYWLAKHGVGRASPAGPRSPERRVARAAGLRVTTLACPRHGRTEFVLERRGYYRCKRCRSAQVSARRRKVKQILVEEAGGRCRICGYHRYPGALEFHHLDPSAKHFPLSRQGVTRGIDELRQEAAKCVLLCANCHAELEGGFISSTLLNESDREAAISGP